MAGARPVILLDGENVAAHAGHYATRFEIHKLSDHEDKDAFFAGIAPRLDGIACSGGAHLKIDGALLDRLPKLSIVAALGVGFSMVDADAVKARGLMMTHGPGANAVAVAELALGLMLAVTRKIPAFDAFVRDGAWADTGTKGGYTPAVSGKTLGIIGLGAIGREIAKRAAAFDMEILFHQRTRRDDTRYRFVESLRDMAAAAHFLAVCCPATAETKHIVNAEVLKALGPEGYLINVSRGSTVDEDALVAALGAGGIAGAGLDVFENEPNVQPELRLFKNVVLSPHRAAFTFETAIRMRDLLMENLVAHFDGRDPPTPVPGFGRKE